MSGGIFLLRGEDDLVPMTEAPYDSEDVLQELLAKFPDLLAGDQLAGADARRWILIDRESAVPDVEDGSGRWSIDHLFLDQDSVPTLVEVKRSSDTRIRREVVGKLIDYAANAVVYWPVERLRAAFEARLERQGGDPDAELEAVLGPDADADAYWNQAAANLKAGRIRLVFVSDEIPRELRRMVEFLNEQMAAEVIAIEVKQYIGPAGLRTLVPRAIGQTAAAETRKRPGEKPLGEGDEIRLRWWTELLEKANAKTRLHAAVKPSRYGSVGTGAGKQGLRFNYAVWRHGMWVELYIDRGPGQNRQNLEVFGGLRAHQEEIEQAFGGPLEWQDLEGKQACRIQPPGIEVGYRSPEDQWPRAHEQAIDEMIRLEAALRPHIEALPM